MVNVPITLNVARPIVIALDRPARGDPLVWPFAAAIEQHRQRTRQIDRIVGDEQRAGDPVDLARAMAILLWRRSEWAHQRIASRRAVERDHDWARNVQRYRDVYHRVLGRVGTETEPA